VVTKTLGSLKRPTTSQILFPIRSFLITQHYDTTISCFDRATHSNGKCCGAGGVIKTYDISVYGWFFNCREGTNTKVELLGVWATLLLEKHLSLHKLQVLGDSKVVIDWINKRGDLRACTIEGWKQRIIALRS